MTNEPEDMENFRGKLEEEFNSLIDKGEDIRCYLYFPHTLLTDNIKKYLDEYLMKEAYRAIDSEIFSPSSFIVYQDSLITVKLEKKEQQKELLERLIDYFSNREEFEKCAKIQKLLKQIPLYE